MSKNDDDLQPWRTIASTTVLKDRWIDLRADTCVTAAGATIAPYYLLQPSDWVHVLAIDEADRAIMVRLYRHGLGDFSLELPGGAQDAADDSPEVAARRELLEETGYVCGPMVHACSLSPNTASHTNRVHFLVARGARVSQLPVREAGETMQTELVPVTALRGLATGGAIMSALHVAGILVALDKLRAGSPGSTAGTQL
jgi:8-oxo-dGTP pyrophosphatase MutT (NUDIX family)